jgi:hypothetical protein
MNGRSYESKYDISLLVRCNVVENTTVVNDEIQLGRHARSQALMQRIGPLQAEQHRDEHSTKKARMNFGLQDLDQAARYPVAGPPLTAGPYMP